MAYNQQALLVGCHLDIVVLVIAFIGAVFHDPRLWIGKVILIFVADSRFGWLWMAPSGLMLTLACFLLALGKLGFIFGFFGLKALFGALFQNHFGFRQIGQPFLAQDHFILDHQTVRSLGFPAIDFLTQREQLVDLAAQLVFQFDQTLVADRLTLGGIRMDLTSIQTDIPQLEHPNRFSQK